MSEWLLIGAWVALGVLVAVGFGSIVFGMNNDIEERDGRRRRT